ncbi:MAG TPA: hypothetical protein VK348_00680, partial [Planctomycetota bacterium]|nr:hypothetical protein [Planctomycetota bacterium]
KEWSVTQKFGGLSSTTPVHDLLSGNSIIDLCTDEVFNYGAAFGQTTQFNLGMGTTPYRHSGKHSVKVTTGVPFAAFAPKLLFIALSDVGKVDVIELQSGRKVASVDVPGVRVVSSYWRQ